MLIQETPGAPNNGFLLNNLKHFLGLLIQSTFRPLEMHSKRFYKICICLVILGKMNLF